jgi:hypothetical protein
MRYTKDDSRHPSQAFFDTCADVLQVCRIFHIRHSVGANYSVDFLLSFLQDVREYEHGLNKADEDPRGGIGACLEERTTDVASLIIAKMFGLLGEENVHRKAWLNSLNQLKRSLGAWYFTSDLHDTCRSRCVSSSPSNDPHREPSLSRRAFLRGARLEPRILEVFGGLGKDRAAEHWRCQQCYPSPQSPIRSVSVSRGIGD